MIMREMFLKKDDVELFDSGNLFAYEESLLKMLLTQSKHKKQHQKLAKQILKIK